MRGNGIFIIFKKEINRFFRDRRTLTALILPGILLYVLYTFMGDAMSSSFMTDEDFKPEIAVVNLPDSLRPLFGDAEVFDLSEPSDPDSSDEYIEHCKTMVESGSKDALIVFPECFDGLISSYEPSAGSLAPNIEIYYNSSETDSSSAYQGIVAILDQFESAMTNRFDVNRLQSENDTYDLAKEEDIAAMTFSMLMPMLLVMLLFSGCMAVAPESIAGEKERGTIASLLITPVKRSHISAGKILALSVMALISGVSSTVGVILSLPKLMGDTVSISGSIYGVSDYVMLAVIILSTVLLLITLVSIISAYAKTVKEASSYVMPLMVVSMVVSISGMIGASADSPWLYLVPIYNSVQSMIGIFSFDASAVNIAITVAANVAITGVGVFVLAKMFNSEKVMFNK